MMLGFSPGIMWLVNIIRSRLNKNNLKNAVKFFLYLFIYLF